MLLDVGGELYKSTWQTLSGSRVLQSLAVGGAEREIFIDRDGQVRPPLTSQPVLHTPAWQMLCSTSIASHVLTACRPMQHVRALQAAVGLQFTVALGALTVPLCPCDSCVTRVKSPHPCATWEPLPL